MEPRTPQNWMRIIEFPSRLLALRARAASSRALPRARFASGPAPRGRRSCVVSQRDLEALVRGDDLERIARLLRGPARGHQDRVLRLVGAHRRVVIEAERLHAGLARDDERVLGRRVAPVRALAILIDG